jgi:hypothetical protein
MQFYITNFSCLRISVSCLELAINVIMFITYVGIIHFQCHVDNCFDSWCANRMSLLKVLGVLLSPSREKRGYHLKLGHRRFLPQYFRFIIP